MKSDTSPEALAVQIDLLRKAGPLRRSTMASNLTNAVMARSRRAIAEANPQLSELEVRLKFVEIFYGQELATGMRDWLRRRLDQGNIDLLVDESTD